MRDGELTRGRTVGTARGEGNVGRMDNVVLRKLCAPAPVPAGIARTQRRAPLFTRRGFGPTSWPIAVPAPSTTFTARVGE